jgi:hypothetical protein
MERAVTMVAAMPKPGTQSGSPMRKTLASLLAFLRIKHRPTNVPNYQQFIEQL